MLKAYIAHISKFPYIYEAQKLTLQCNIPKFTQIDLLRWTLYIELHSQSYPTVFEQSYDYLII